MDDEGTRDTSENEAARDAAFETALIRYASCQIESLTALPPAWVQAPPRHRFRTDRHNDEPVWREPDRSFDHRIAERIIREFPVEAWCASSKFRPLFLSYLEQLIAWTASKLAPDWRDDHDRRRGRDRADLNHWPMQLADLIVEMKRKT